MTYEQREAPAVLYCNGGQAQMPRAPFAPECPGAPPSLISMLRSMVARSAVREGD